MASVCCGIHVAVPVFYRHARWNQAREQEEKQCKPDLVWTGVFARVFRDDDDEVFIAFQMVQVFPGDVAYERVADLERQVTNVFADGLAATVDRQCRQAKLLAHPLEYAELILFLLVAMTYIIAMV